MLVIKLIAEGLGPGFLLYLICVIGNRNGTVGIHVENTKVHFIYANKMGAKYLKRYKKYFRDPEIR